MTTATLNEHELADAKRNTQTEKANGTPNSRWQVSHLVNVVFFAQRKPNHAGGQIIGITAPVHGEGVTTICHLAARELAGLDRNRTLLVSTETLEQVQADHLARFADLWAENPAAGYWGPSPLLLNAGVSASSLWKSDISFRNRVLENLRASFQSVVLDCRPVRGSSDMALLGNLIDGFILVVKSDGSTQDQLHEAIRIVQLNNGEIKGCCFNRETNPIPSRLSRWFKR